MVQWNLVPEQCGKQLGKKGSVSKESEVPIIPQQPFNLIQGVFTLKRLNKGNIGEAEREVRRNAVIKKTSK